MLLVETVNSVQPVFRESKLSKARPEALGVRAEPSKDRPRDKKLELELMRWADDGGRNDDFQVALCCAAALAGGEGK
jgi:hypothetical protein